jgi:hypothetical protein
LIAETAIRFLLPQNLSGTWREADQNGITLNRPNWSARHQLADRIVRYTFDEHGLRIVAKAGERRGVRVLCLGDSITFGWLLNDEDTYICHLQHRADAEFGQGRVTLLNAGHGGWGTSDYVRYVEEYGSRLNIAGIVVFLSADDIGRSLRRPKYELVETKPVELRKLYVSRKSGMKAIVNGIPAYQWLLVHSHLFQLCRNVAVGQPVYRRPPPRWDGQPWLESPMQEDPVEARQLGRALFCRLRDWADAHSCELLVLTTGFHLRGQGGPIVDNDEPTRAFMTNVEAMFEEEGISFYDCSTALRTRIRGDYTKLCIFGDGHPNQTGARLIADLNWPSVSSYVADLLPQRAPTQLDAEEATRMSARNRLRR